MMSIFNIFQNLDESSTKPIKSKRNKKTDNTTSYRHHQFNNNAPTPTLDQGLKFKNYQNKIVKKGSKNAAFVSKEGFQSSYTDASNSYTDASYNLSQQAQQVLSQTQISSQDQDTLSNLQSQYAETLVKYQVLKKAMNKATTNYFNRIDSSTNPYLNQNVQFSTGEIAYVTNRGVLKIYTDQTIYQNTAGLNGCPSGYTSINIPWQNNYLIPGTIIPTNPTLITGTPMQQGQSCGYEGQNVFVNSLYSSSNMSDISYNYLNCYADSSNNPAMTFIGGSPSSDSSGNYTFQMCQQAALNNGSSLFALQDVDITSGLGYCAISNSLDDTTQYGLSYIPTQVILWQSNTSGQGNTALVTDTGSLVVIDASGTNIYSTPYDSSYISSYYGCYQDKSSKPAMSKNKGSGYTYETCMQEAQDGNYSYFGLQNVQPNNEANCFLSNNFSQTTEYGKAGNCKSISGVSYGGGNANAVYNASSGTANYYLKINDNGKLSVHRGQGSKDNQEEIWNSGTKDQSQDANPAYTSSNGVYGTQYMTQNQTLSSGQFLGSPSGKTALIMEPSGNLVLVTFQMPINCQRMNNGYMGGGVSGNAVYTISPTPNTSIYGSVAYVSPNSDLYSYPSSSIQYSNTYTNIPNMTNSNYSITNASFSNTTLQQCQNACNSNSSCAGFVFSNSTNTCTPKSSGFWPNSNAIYSDDDNIYVRNPAINNYPTGVPNNINGIDAITYQNYIQSGSQVGSNMSGLSSATSVQQQQLQQLEDQLSMLSEQISTYSTQFSSNGQLVQNQITSDVSGSSMYMNKLNMLNQQIKNSTTGIDGILNDSNIVVLQQSYNYMFWSTLAVGALLISINMKNK